MRNILTIKQFKSWLYLLIAYTLSFTMCFEGKNEIEIFNNNIYSKYLGRGYDILFGYPLANSELREDPGFKEIIFDIRNTMNVLPDFVCKKDEYLTVIEGVNDVMNISMENINIDDLDTNIRPFSASMPYLSYFTDLELKKKKYAIAQNICLYNYATFNLSESTKFINKEFLADIEKLPILSKKEDKCLKALYMYDSSNKHCSKTIKLWIDFFQKYGTHLLVSARFGGRSLSSMEITLEKSEEIKIYNYKYYIRNVPYLNIFNALSLSQDMLKSKINRKCDIRQKSLQNKIETNLCIRGGNSIDENWNELTYEIWKHSIYSNFVPIYLDLISLSSFMSKDKKESYNNALLYYNDLYGASKENFYLSENITDVFSGGKQITGSSKRSLVLSCPVGYIKSTGFIFSYNASDKLKKLDNTESKIKIHPCYNKGEYDISCSHITKNDDIINFGWIYCVKHNFMKFESVYKGSNNEKESSLKIKCPEGSTLAFGFKMKLKKERDLEKIKIRPCELGNGECSINKMKTDSDYLLWGFCVPLSFRSISTLHVLYINEKDVSSDVQGTCTDRYINKYDNIFLGFTFSFDKNLEEIKISSCKTNSKLCVSKLNKKNEKNYVGMFLLCRNDGILKRNFKHL